MDSIDREVHCIQKKDKELERLIMYYLKTHGCWLCKINKKVNQYLECQVLMNAFMKKLGKEKVKEILKGIIISDEK